MKTTQSLIHSTALLTFLIIFAEKSWASYSLSTGLCERAVTTIGNILHTSQADKLIKNTYVSPRCEVRRMLGLYGDKTTSFMLRKIEVAKRRRWTANYFFYSDQDCIQQTYGVQLQGRLRFKSKILTLNISSVEIAVYKKGIERDLQAKYNASCAGHMRQTGSGTPAIYTLDSTDFSKPKDRCFKAIGLAEIEFTDLIFEIHHPSGGSRTDELLQRRAAEMYQWPLVRHNTPMCLTCAKVKLAILKYPPVLYTRNATSLDGVWGTTRCKKESFHVHMMRVDRYDGNKFDVSLYVMDQESSQLCSNPAYEIRFIGTFREVGPSVTIPGGVVYEMLVIEALLTAYTKLQARTFNIGNDISHGCGMKLWEPHVTQDIMITKGCDKINQKIEPGTPLLTVIRTYRDENRNHLLFGGDIGYRFHSQDCSTFPIEMTTTPGPSSTASTIQTTTSTEEDEVTDEYVVYDEGREIFGNRPTGEATSMNYAVLRTILACLLLYLQAVRLV